MSRSQILHPARAIPVAFLGAILVGTLLLMMPMAREGAEGAPVLVALFTATSAVSITGLAVVDTSTYWSGLGQAIILLLVQVGGFSLRGAFVAVSLPHRRVGPMRVGLKART